MRKKIYLIYSFLLLVFFLFFSYFVAKKLFNKIDFDLMVKIQDKIPKSFDIAFSFLSLLGSFEVTLVILVIILYFVKKKLWFLTVMSAFFLGHLFEFAGKIFIHHSGPPFRFFRYDIPFLFPTSYVQTGFSYPSGHSFRSVFLISLAIFLTLKHLKKTGEKFIAVLLLFLLLTAVLISRVSLGEHWISDVIGGVILGLSLGYLTLNFYK